jgi:hypothetical protein
MYSWGKLTSGQLGLGSGLEETYISTPRPVPAFGQEQNEVILKTKGVPEFYFTFANIKSLVFERKEYWSADCHSKNRQ